MPFNEEIRITGKYLAEPEFSKATRSTRKLGNETEKAGRKMKASFLASKSALLGYVGAFIGLASAVAFLKAATSAGLENEQENAALKNQVELTGAAWDDYGDTINSVIQAQANYGVLTRTETSMVLRRLILITGDVRTAQENLSLTLDLATAANLDNVASAQLVGRALEGDIEALGRYFPAIKQLTKELGAGASMSLKAAKGIEILRQKTNGAAGAIDENVKKMREANVAWSEFQDAAGGIILEILNPMAGGLETITRKLEEQLILIRESDNLWRTWGTTIAMNNPVIATAVFLWESLAEALNLTDKKPSITLLDPSVFLPAGVSDLRELLQKRRDEAKIEVALQDKFRLEKVARDEEEAERKRAGREQEIMGEEILANAQIKFAEDAAKGKEAARKRDFSTAINLSNALFIFTGQKSKSLFKVTKALNLAEATTSGITAIMKAASALPFPANLPGIASMTAFHALNIAKISATKFGGGGGGGASVGGLGGGGTPLIGATASGADLSSRLDANQQQGATINLTVQALDPEGVDWDRVIGDVMEAAGNHIDRGGSTGPVTFNVERN